MRAEATPKVNLSVAVDERPSKSSRILFLNRCDLSENVFADGLDSRHAVIGAKEFVKLQTIRFAVHVVFIGQEIRIRRQQNARARFVQGAALYRKFIWLGRRAGA